MATTVLYKDQARQKLLEGVNKITDAVASTLGPLGKNAILSQDYGTPIITKDGITVAKKVASEDPRVDMGIRLLREAASQTNNVVGDGTTTATVLARAIFVEGLKCVTAGSNPMELKRGIDKALEKVVATLKLQAKEIKETNQIRQIATISANGDEKVGDMIAQAVEKVGDGGVITVEEAKSTQTELKVVKGMQFDRGYESPYFITNQKKMTTELETPYILVAKKKISVLKDILGLLGAVAKTGRPLLIISEGVEGQAMTALILNTMQGALKLASAKAPGFGDNKDNMLEDIATLTGATVIAEETGQSLAKARLEHLGTAEKVNIDKDTTTIVKGGGSKQAIEDRVYQIKQLMRDETSEYAREKLQERLAKLSDGVAVIFAGAETEVAMKELKDRIEDSLSATRAAIEKGIVPGGGVALVRAAGKLDSLIQDLEHDQATGAKIVQKALEAPTRTIAANAGFEGSVVLQKVREGNEDFGYNAAKNTYGRLYEAGVVDPLKVVECAVRNAASIAGILLTTDCIVCEKKEKAKDTNVNTPMMNGMM